MPGASSAPRSTPSQAHSKRVQNYHAKRLSAQLQLCIISGGGHAGLPATSVMWGAWALGMAATPATLLRFERMGMGAIRPSLGLQALEALLLAQFPPEPLPQVGLPLLSNSVLDMGSLPVFQKAQNRYLSTRDAIYASHVMQLAK